MNRCNNFSCKIKGSCINADNHCNDFQFCPKIKAHGLCAVCALEKVCIIGKEKKKNARHG